MASDEFYQISCSWRRQWFVFDSLILSLGDTAAQILRMLPKLEKLRRDDSPMSFEELSAVSKSMVLLRCMKGFDFDPAHVDISSLRFPHLEKVTVVSKNSIIPQGRVFLKSLILIHSPLYRRVNASINREQFIYSLIKIIEVWDFYLKNEKASPGMSLLKLNFHPISEAVNLDSCLDIIFGLSHITTLSLIWNRVSLENIKSLLRKQGGKKRWEALVLGRFDQEMNDADILEICSYLPNLRQWSVLSPRTNISIDGAREWKRICLNLQTVRGVGLSDEVKEVLQGLGVTVRR
jgi:hypothetical protein